MHAIQLWPRPTVPRRSVCALALLFVIASPAFEVETAFGVGQRHAEITLLGVNRSGESLVRFRGQIRKGDGQTFLDVTRSLTKAVVILDSPGGIGLDGLIIGEAIRTKGFVTVVSPKATCASACAIIWLSGVKRSIGPGGRVGFHAAFELDSHRVSGSGNALIGAYLKSLDLPYETIAYLTNAPPSSITWLDPNAAAKYAIRLEPYDPQASQLDTEATSPRTFKPYVVRAAKATVACMHYLMVHPGSSWLRRPVPARPRYRRYEFEVNCWGVEARLKFVVTRADPAAKLLCIRAALPNCDWAPATDFRTTADAPWAALPVTLIRTKPSAHEPQ